MVYSCITDMSYLDHPLVCNPNKRQSRTYCDFATNLRGKLDNPSL